MPRSSEGKYRSSSENDPWERLPESWRLMPLGRVARIAASNVDKKTDPDEVPVRLCNYTDVYYNEFINDDLDFMKASATLREIDAFRLRGGEVLLTKDSETAEDIAKPAFVRPGLDGVVCGYHLYVLRPRPEVMDGRFLMRACSVPPVSDQFVIGANGITRFGLGQQKLASALIPVPPLSRQRSIADFLDRETARIDDLIAQKKRLLELLDEQRTAMITRAVTKGLDSDVEMKDSGVEWLGEIPTRWEAIELRYLVDPKTTITYGIVQAGPHIKDGVPYIRTGDMSGDSLPETGYKRTSLEIDKAYRRSKLATGDIIVAIRATVGKALQVPDHLAGANLTQGTARVSPGPRILSKFLLYALQSKRNKQRFDALAKGATFREITLDMLRRVRIPVPPLPQQVHLIAALEEIELASLAAKADVVDVLRLLTEYRTGLICAAVTGKIDIKQGAEVHA